MSSPLSPRDLEALSAFLDNQLPTPQRNRLQARLLTEPALQAALEGLRQTRALLRRAPKARPRRNFALTPEQVQSRRGSHWDGSLRMVSVLATVLFALVVAGDWWSSHGVVGWMGGAAAPAVGQGGAEAAADMAAPAEAEPEEETRIAESAPAEPEDTAAEEPDLEMGAFALEPPGEEYTEAASEAVGGQPGWRAWLRPAQILLALVALAAGFSSWWLQRRQKSGI